MPDLSQEFKYIKNNDEYTLYYFNPRTNESLYDFQAKFKPSKLFYFQPISEHPLIGEIYSNIYFCQRAEIQFQNAVDTNFTIEKGISHDNYNSVKNLFSEENHNEIIYPNEFIRNFDENSKKISTTDFSVQIYCENQLIGHASAIRISNPLFSVDKLFLLMRFIVRKSYRRSDAKEILLRELNNFLPSDSSIFFQVFRNNEVAKRFFSKRFKINEIHYKMLFK